jgi:hypothetical protein
MSKVLNLIFTEDFFAGGVLTNADEAGATIELLEVDGFQLLPLYFELKNDSIIYLIGKKISSVRKGVSFLETTHRLSIAILLFLYLVRTMP